MARKSSSGLRIPLARAIFRCTQFAWLWLIVRVWLGYNWVEAASHTTLATRRGFGAFMNWNFMMAGTAGTNPTLFAVGILLILGWKMAGYGLDRYLLPLLGAPWRPGEVF